ncbi:hypothetical protein GCM10020369_47910 [Cryptosporangium minutisporangium]|uniref:Uncharacterized protein n=1 Tax=Cryptosporangium minutisporangium TaxID=113569 RepID=A0ABP6T321_9ACTN
MHAFLGCPDPRCDYAVRFHAPDLLSPPESLVRAWARLLQDEHPLHPRALPRRRSQTVPVIPAP